MSRQKMGLESKRVAVVRVSLLIRFRMHFRCLKLVRVLLYLQGLHIPHVSMICSGSRDERNSLIGKVWTVTAVVGWISVRADSED